MVKTRSQFYKSYVTSNKKIKKEKNDSHAILLPNNCHQNVKTNILTLLEYEKNREKFSIETRIKFSIKVFEILKSPFADKLLNNEKFRNVTKNKLIELHFHKKNCSRQFYKIYRDIFGERMPVQ